MLYGINVVLFVATAVCIALYLLRRRSRIVSTELKLRSALE